MGRAALCGLSLEKIEVRKGRTCGGREGPHGREPLDLRNGLRAPVEQAPQLKRSSYIGMVDGSNAQARKRGERRCGEDGTKDV